MTKNLVCGVGYRIGKYKTTIGGKRLKENNLWINMIQRCYSEDYHKNFPTYADCEVSDYFKCYDNFYKWCQEQVGFGKPNFALDKDLLFKRNKIYSEDTCVFIPNTINSFLTKSNNIRGNLPIGVYYSKTRDCYVGNISINGKTYNLGGFDSPEKAFIKYKMEKEKYTKFLAEKYKSDIDERVYQALMSYEVDIND